MVKTESFEAENETILKQEIIPKIEIPDEIIPQNEIDVEIITKNDIAGEKFIDGKENIKSEHYYRHRLPPVLPFNSFKVIKSLSISKLLVYSTNPNSEDGTRTSDCLMDRSNTSSTSLKLESYVCYHCHYRTEKKKNLSLHIKSIHLKEKSHTCNTTGFSLGSKHHINASEVSLSNEDSSEENLNKLRGYGLSVRKNEPFKNNTLKQCALCEFVTARNLRLHMVEVHRDGKYFKCPNCSYSSKYTNHVKRHMLAKHTVEKPLKCNRCSYTTGSQTHLNLHKTSKHSKKRPFSCKLCIYKSVRKEHLKRHFLAKHTDEKPNKCKLCNYSTVQKSALKFHCLSKHTNETIQCRYCGYCTVIPYHLKRHIIGVHGIC